MDWAEIVSVYFVAKEVETINLRVTQIISNKQVKDV